MGEKELKRERVKWEILIRVTYSDRHEKTVFGEIVNFSSLLNIWDTKALKVVADQAL